MKAIHKVKNSAISIVTSLSLLACNGGGSAGSNPQTSKLPNVFDPTSVQEIKFETFKLDGSYAPEIDLSKVGGHATYLLKITNPNDFAMNVTELGLDGNGSGANFYLAKNDHPDNCFNQSWYHSNSDGASLNLPAHGSCSFYTTSLWPGIENRGGDYPLKHKIVNPGFGYTANGQQKTDLWCQHDCLPVDNRSSDPLPLKHNSVRFVTAPIPLSHNHALESVELNGIALGGDYMFSPGVSRPGNLDFTRFKVKYNIQRRDLEVITSNLINTFLGVDHIPKYSGFSTRRDGSYITYTIGLTGNKLATTFQPANSNGTAYSFKQITGQEPTFGLQGLDNNIWWNSASYYLFYQTYKVDFPIEPLDKLSPFLPSNNSVIWGVDADGNMVIKTGSGISCYRRLGGYLPVANLSSFNNVGNSLISSNYLYTHGAANAERYYNFSGKQLATDLYYRLNTGVCQPLANLPGNLNAFLAVPKDQTLIITDKYTAIRSSDGYAFAAADATSDGSNSME